MSLVKFFTGEESDLNARPVTNGNVYFLPNANDGLGNIAYDLDDCRSWVTSSKILTVSELDSSIPRLGTLIVVTDALSTIDESTKEITTLPGLKIGDGVTSIMGLPYLNDSYRVSAEILSEQYNNHIADTNIHHTKNAQVVPQGDKFVLQILNYDS